MRLAVLDCAVLRDTPLETYETVGKLVESWLAPHLPGAQFTRIGIADGKAFPPADAFDGYILPGSELGVYDDTPWMAPLFDFLRQLRAARTPLVGICFGHQAMAQAFGGQARKLDQVIAIGARSFESDTGPITAHVAHQDQVTVLPPEARITGRADYCPIAQLEYSFPAMSMQFHPEYSRDFIRSVIAMFSDDFLPAQARTEALRSLEEKTVRADLCGAEVAQFFRHHL